jgi:hypothetical protein
VQKKRERMSIEDDIRALVTDRGRAVGTDGRQAARSYLLQKHDIPQRKYSGILRI